MLRLLIADDEKYDRDSIVNILNSDFKNQLEISEAKNGREEIELSEQLRPDIIITDIKMPGINGLKAIQEIKKFLPNAYFIILTAYDYFDFAVEAVKENVKEYILKPFSRTELIEKINQAVNFVNSEKDKRKNEIENEEKLSNLMPILENELCYSIINDTILSIDYETYMKYLNIDFKSAYCIIVQLKESSNSIKNMKLQIGDYIKEYISRKFRNIASYIFTKELIYFIQLKNYEDDKSRKFKIINLANEIKREINKIFHIHINIGIGNCYNELSLMHKSYEEACICLEHNPENNSIVYFQDINTNMTEKILLNEKLKSIDREKIALFKAVEQYIIDNIQDEISLESISSRFNLSPYYFSRTFKEMLGYNFSDYINIVRINKAKEFLKDDSRSIKEICYSVGYSDPNYFSKVFKKYEGISPTEFKIKAL